MITIILFIIVIILVAATVGILIVVIMIENKTTTSGIVFSARKEYTSRFYVWLISKKTLSLSLSSTAYGSWSVRKNELEIVRSLFLGSVVHLFNWNKQNSLQFLFDRSCREVITSFIGGKRYLKPLLEKHKNSKTDFRIRVPNLVYGSYLTVKARQ